MILFEMLLTLSLLSWLLIGASIVALFCSSYSYRKRDRGVSIFWAIITFVALLLCGYANIGKHIDWETAKVFAYNVLMWWMIGAVATAVIYWLFFIRDVKRRYTDNLERVTATLLKSKAFRFWPEDVKQLAGKAYAIIDGNDYDDIFLARPRISENVKSALGKVSEYYEAETKKIEARKPWDPNSGLPNDSQGDPSTIVPTEPIPIDDPRKLVILQNAINDVLPPRAKHFKADITFSAVIWPVTLISLIAYDLIDHLVNALFNAFKGALDQVSKVVFGKF